MATAKQRTNPFYPMDTIVMPRQILPSGELAELAKKELNAYLDNITAAKTLDHILQENQNTRNDERRENSSEKDYPAYGDGSRKDGALGTGILSAEKPVATVSGESGGIARFDRPDRNTGDAVAAGSTRTGRRSGSSGRVLLINSSDRVTVRRSRNKYPSAKK